MSDFATILIVDDEEAIRSAVRSLLSRDGHRLVVASSGLEAMSQLEALPIDLVICDVVMPGMGGLALCAAIKSHPEWRYIPTILLTALGGEDDMVRGLAAGADDFLSKPVDGVLLRARVHALLRIRAQYREARAAPRDVEALLRARRDQRIAEASLTEREREVLELLLLGRTHAEVGVVLGISARTAIFHQQNILRKLGADSRIDLLRLFA